MRKLIRISFYAMIILGLTAAITVSLGLHQSILEYRFGNSIPTENIDEFSIKFSKKGAYNKLLDAYKFMGENAEPEKFKKSNKWKKATISFKNKEYKAKIRCHGKHPDAEGPIAHLNGNRFSMRIKLLDGKINDVKEFSLIIYDRIGSKFEKIKLVCDLMNVKYIEDKLCKAKIDNEIDDLYFFEFKTNSKYLQLNDSNNLILSAKTKGSHFEEINYYNRSSIIGAKSKSLEDHISKIEKSISELKNYSEDQKRQIFEDYVKINRFIWESNSDSILSLFDTAYVGKFNSVRLLFKSIGHGFDIDNLVLVYNINSRQFTPYFHRDCFYEMNPYSKEEIMNYCKIINRLFYDLHVDNDSILGRELLWLQVLEKNDFIVKERNSAVEKIISNKSYIIEKLDSIESVHQALYVRGKIKKIMGKKITENYTSKNLEMLHHILE